MTPSTPMPEHLVTLVPADVAVHLLGRAGLAEYRRKHRGENGRVDDVLLAMSKAAYRWCEMADKGQNRAPNADTDTDLLTTRQAADITRWSPRSIRRAIAAKQLPARLAGRAYLIRRDDLTEWRQRQ